MHSVNYKDYLNLVLKGAGLCLFEVDVEKQRYVRFENAEPYIRYPERRFCLIWKSFHP